MSKIVKEVTLGIDVSKLNLDIHNGHIEDNQILSNESAKIDAFLSGLTGPVSIAVEVTNTYHEELVDQALAHGFTVYLVDGYKLNKYREAVGVRAKTDLNDAQLLHRYLVSERSHLQPVRPQSPKQRQLWRLIKRRAKRGNLRTQLRLSLSGISIQGTEVDDAIKGINKLINRITHLATQLAEQLKWTNTVKQLQSIPGIGPLNALALVGMYHRGQFTKADRFIAFLGLDVRVRDSGTHRGRRKLTKKGDPEVRRLLFNAARSAAYNYPQWQDKKQKLMQKGFSEIQVSVILARKIARIAFALMKNKSVYLEQHNTCITS